MLDRNKIKKMANILDNKDVEEMTKKELIELVETLTDGFIVVYNDNVTLSQILHNLRGSLDDIDYNISQLIDDIDSL